MNKIQQIIQIVSDETGIPVADIIGSSRKSDKILARHLSLWACRWNSGASLEKIAREHNLAQHGTVIHAALSIDNQLRYNTKVQQICKQITSILNN